MVKNIFVRKKDGTLEIFKIEKIINAVSKSSKRILHDFTEEEQSVLKNSVKEYIKEYITKKYDSDADEAEIPIAVMHSIVEMSLDKVDTRIAKSYRDYRNYKTSFVEMLDDIYKKAQNIMYIGDRENANTDSTLVSTKRSLIYNEFNKELYQKFQMDKETLQACREGYIYIHDMSARRDTMNCCLFDIATVLRNGFEMGNVFYNEPKSLDTAFDVMGDIILSAASQQYGGFTVSRVDEILNKYAELSYEKYKKDIYLSKSKSHKNDMSDSIVEELLKESEEEAKQKVERDFMQGFQGWEYKFNTVASSRGDYPFITITIGVGTKEFEKMATRCCLRVRKGGQGKPGFKKHVLFPKIVFTYTEELHGPGMPNEDLFEEGIDCSSKAMYPDWLSLDGDTDVARMWHKYGEIIAPMGCRAFLSPYYERGGTEPADENDRPFFIGRFNIGAVSLNLPMILMKSRHENLDFYKVLDYYLELIRRTHKMTYEYLGEMKASCNPLAYCEGGFHDGFLKPTDKIRPLLKYTTASFGITALNELNELYNGKSIYEDGEFPLEVMKYISEVKLPQFKEEDHINYAVYGTPAESLCSTQVKQFRAKYGIVPNVSDRGYVSNSFHCHVSEDIDGIQKQDSELRFWNLHKGGRIQYVKYGIDYNKDAIRTYVRRAMSLGLYEGVNLVLSYCEDCGHSENGMDECPVCHSKNICKIERMNGYLAYSRVHGHTRLNDGKMEEIGDRKSM